MFLFCQINRLCLKCSIEKKSFITHSVDSVGAESMAVIRTTKSENAIVSFITNGTTDFQVGAKKNQIHTVQLSQRNCKFHSVFYARIFETLGNKQRWKRTRNYSSLFAGKRP